VQQEQSIIEYEHCTAAPREPWKKGKVVGQQSRFKLREVWAIRVRLQSAGRRYELALSNLAIDSELRACGLVTLNFRDVCYDTNVTLRAIVM
jgi:hypothetical protein